MNSFKFNWNNKHLWSDRCILLTDKSDLDVIIAKAIIEGVPDIIDEYPIIRRVEPLPDIEKLYAVRYYVLINENFYRLHSHQNYVKFINDATLTYQIRSVNNIIDKLFWEGEIITSFEWKEKQIKLNLSSIL